MISKSDCWRFEQMQRWIYNFFVLGNLVAAVLLIFSFEPLSETVEVANEKAIPILRQLPDQHDQQVNYVERMLASMQTRATRARTVVRLIAAWLLVNAGFYWGLRRRLQAEKTRLSPLRSDPDSQQPAQKL